MRLLLIDIDSLRPDHLGCYGYARATSPHIDALARDGVRFTEVYASDTPCLPSRTALWSGQFGIHNGVVNHGGAAAEPFGDGAGREMQTVLGRTNWMRCLRELGYKTVTVSPFGERHSAWHWYAGFSEVYNTGRIGMERADEIAAVALDWLARSGQQDNWFLHVNLWDTHTPYRTPPEWGNPFAQDPLPDWLTEDVRRAHWQGCGPHSAQEVLGFGTEWEYAGNADYPLNPEQMASMTDVRRLFDGYDCGVRYADEYVGRLLNALSDLGVWEETAVIVTADHGENLGELNIYADHQTADLITPHVPLIVRWPGVTDTQAGRTDNALHYQLDFAATTVDLLGGEVPSHWDGESFAGALRSAQSVGRESLTLSQGAWCVQRAVRWGDYLCLRTYHDAYHDFPDTLLFDAAHDPHEQRDLSAERPDLIRDALARLQEWTDTMRRTSAHPDKDPLWTALAEGGGLHARHAFPAYLNRLRQTGRAACAARLQARSARELPPIGA